MAAIVIADASPLIALARVNGLGWLEALFGQVLVTEEGMAEVLSAGYPAREEPIQAAIASGWHRAFSLLDEARLSLDTTDSSHQQSTLHEALLEPSRWAGLLI